MKVVISGILLATLPKEFDGTKNKEQECQRLHIGPCCCLIQKLLASATLCVFFVDFLLKHLGSNNVFDVWNQMLEDVGKPQVHDVQLNSLKSQFAKTAVDNLHDRSHGQRLFPLRTLHVRIKAFFCMN